ncbi:hypothetical protein BBJ29_000129 [Phytophthora kernoviae]|uniref:Prefoldin subunit 1 n=1 Tax=Phytophthora kernoviae TaxID=325452 RepID=A0A3F2S1C2_9STRA|nr:hypothetical protein BBJ29_000129 [Phytophthora kernoviae]RLN68443.1 hypothetical protein BBP00_00000993 [Phytophthora kernoviae]
MAKIEKVVETNVDERWKTQRLAQKIDAELQQLKVALSELDTVKPKKMTYTKKANVFFLDKRDVIVTTKKNELKDKEKKRYDVGLQLRDLK